MGGVQGQFWAAKDYQSVRVGAMWRAAGISYLRYSSEMASILRQCLREPYREAALQRDTVHLAEKAWANGAVQSKVIIDDMSKGFEVAKRGASAADGKK